MGMEKQTINLDALGKALYERFLSQLPLTFIGPPIPYAFKQAINPFLASLSKSFRALKKIRDHDGFAPDSDEERWYLEVRAFLLSVQSIKLETDGPYIDGKYNPNYGDDKKCECSHAYYRHFDTYDDMRPVGCKYCECRRFTELGAVLD